MSAIPSSLKASSMLRAGAVSAVLAGLLAASAALAQAPIRVGVVSAGTKEISKGADFVGRVDAVEKVEIRARVKGYLDFGQVRRGPGGQGRRAAL